MPTLLRWIEAHEAQLVAERVVLARWEGEREAPARHAGTPESPAFGLAAPIRGVLMRLAQARDALLGRSGGTAAVSKPTTKAAILFLGLFAIMGAVSLSPVPGEAQMAPAEATPVASPGSESGEAVGVVTATGPAAEAAEIDRLWGVVREEVLPGRLPEEAQRLVWRRLWQLDPSFRESDGLDEIGTATAAAAAEGRATGETAAFAARRDAEAR
jgi:hypothetical protein